MSHSGFLGAAERYVESGISVIPTGHITPYAKKPHSAALKASGLSYWDSVENKIRATWLPLKERLTMQSELRTWFNSFKVEGIAMVTGELSGLIVLDFDAGAGVTLMHELGIEPHIATPSGGFHAYMRHPNWFVSTSNAKINQSLPAGLDIRADGGLCMLPPTVTDFGPYTRLSRKSLVKKTELPKELLATLGLIHPPVPREMKPLESPPRDWERRDVNELIEYALMITRSRGRNQAGYVLAIQLRSHFYREQEAIELAGY